MYNLKKMMYSLKHREVVLMLAKKMLAEDQYREFMRKCQYHDMDKVLQYTCNSVLSVHSAHVSHSSHHFQTEGQKSSLDLIEMIFDWESARYTKADKPLNAYDTLYSHYSEYEDIVLPYLSMLGLDRSATEKDADIIAQAAQLSFDLSDVMKMIGDYVEAILDRKVVPYFDAEETLKRMYLSLSMEERELFNATMSDRVQKLAKSSTDRKLRVLLFTHKGCDYDAVASTLSLATVFRRNENIEVMPIIEPHSFSIPLQEMRCYREEEITGLDFDYGIVCDVNEQDRLYGLDIFQKIPAQYCYVFDHHDQNRVELSIPESNKIVDAKASSTCELLVSYFRKHQIPIDSAMAYGLYMGMVSDTAGFRRNVTAKTESVIQSLPLTNDVKECIVREMMKMTPLQEELYHSIERVFTDVPGLALYQLLKGEEAGDITKHLKHEAIDRLTSPTEEFPVSCFIIGSGNHFFLKLKKLESCDIDLLSVALACHGGGHATRCAGRFYDDTYEHVLTYFLEEYRKVCSIEKKYYLS